jgi:predicted phage tail protein
MAAFQENLSVKQKLQERADGLRELRLDSVDKQLNELGDKSGAKAKNSKDSVKDERSEEDDIAIRKAIVEVEEGLKPQGGFQIPFGALAIVILAWIFRNELLELEFVQSILQKLK